MPTSTNDGSQNRLPQDRVTSSVSTDKQNVSKEKENPATPVSKTTHGATTASNKPTPETPETKTTNSSVVDVTNKANANDTTPPPISKPTSTTGMDAANTAGLKDTTNEVAKAKEQPDNLAIQEPSVSDGPLHAQATPKPGATTPKPAATTSKQAETSPNQAETTSKPVETTSKPAETTGKLSSTEARPVSEPSQPKAASVKEPAGSPVSATTTLAQDASEEEEEEDNGIHYSMKSPELYLNRELTWLSFDERVLHEAEDPRNPLLERVKFLAISDNNLDEFVMKRISWLKLQQASGIQSTTVDGRTPAQQIAECNEVMHRLRDKQEAVYEELIRELDQHGIRFLAYRDLNEAQSKQIRDYYMENIFPIVTPLALDPGHPFPFISNLTINLLLTMRYPGETELQTARVKVPLIKDLTSRLIPLKKEGSAYLFVTLEDVIANNLDLIFPGMEIVSCESFRVTRNINIVPMEDTTTNLVEMMESELRERRFAPIVRLEVEEGMDQTHRGMLASEMSLDPETDVLESSCLLGMRDLFEIAGLDIPELHEAPHQPADHPILATDTRNIFHIIRENGPLLLQHPYQSFNTSVERFLRTASEDPKVLAIKMTLYRTSAKAEIIDLLVNAARNGKQVAVLVELRARFDEAANIDRGRMLEEAGVHVTYGVLGLKTHSKTILVVRQDFDQLRHYCHIGTGNYNPDTATLYCDMGLLTCDEDIGHDLTQLFNYLTGYSPPPSYRKILAAPYAMKKPLIKKIEREASIHTEDSPGHIQLKTNALEDPDIAKAIYKAARVGVKIDLIVRDSCRVIPGLPDLSENVTIVSIVGRFLEHARIYYFRNGGEEEYYLGSADLMQRNLEDRVEVLVPVEDEELRQDIRLVLTAQLSDSRNAWDLQPDGTYVQRQPTNEKAKRGSQEDLIAAAGKRQDAAADLRKGQTSMSKEKKVRRKLLNRFEKRLQDSNN